MRVTSVLELCLALLVLTLAACPGDDDGGGDADGWGSEAHPLPEGARLVSEEEYARLGEEGQLFPYLPTDDAEAEAQAEERQLENQAYVDAYAAAHPEVADRLAEPELSSTAWRRSDGNYDVTFVNNQGEEQDVVTLGSAWRTGTIADMLRRGGNQANQLTIFNRIQPASPEECRAAAPDPADAPGLTAEELLAANEALGACWQESMMTRRVPHTSGPADRPDMAIGDPEPFGGAHTGDDVEASTCGCSEFWHDLPQFLQQYDSPVKNQGHRGTCTAFGVVGALENLVARSGEEPINLSEQALYWWAQWQGYHSGENRDGIYPNEIIDGLIETGFVIPYEHKWPYNPSPYRVGCGGNQDPNAPVRVDCRRGEWGWGWRYSCNAPGMGAVDEYEGPACSNTLHQAQLVCYETFDEQDPYRCAFWAPDWSVGYGVADSIEWLNAECLDNSACWPFVKQALWNGWSAIVSIDVYEYFRATPASGFPGAPASPPRYVGGHTMQVSGWVFNHDLPEGTPPSPGAGYFIVRNSWGTCFGDCGYAYLSDDWMIQNVNSIIALTATPAGYNNPPSVTITTPSDGAHFSYGGLADTIHFEADVDDLEDDVSGCEITWYLDTPWGYREVGTGTSADLSFNELAFDDEGRYDVVIAAEDTEFGRTEDRVSIYFDNDTPTAEITSPAPGAEFVLGATVPLAGIGYDANEPAFSCDNLTWESNSNLDRAGAYFPATGCYPEVVFHATGPRTLTLTAEDELGATGTDTVSILIVDPPINAPPIVTVVHPSRGESFRRDEAITLTAEVLETDGDAATGERWTVRRAGGSEIDVGTSNPLTWQYLDRFSCNCDSVDVTARFYASDEDGTASDEVSFIILCPPC